MPVFGAIVTAIKNRRRKWPDYCPKVGCGCCARQLAHTISNALTAPNSPPGIPKGPEDCFGVALGHTDRASPSRCQAGERQHRQNASHDHSSVHSSLHIAAKRLAMPFLLWGAVRRGGLVDSQGCPDRN